LSEYIQDGIISGLLISSVPGYMNINSSVGIGRLNNIEINYGESIMAVDAADETYDRADAIFITPTKVVYVAGEPSDILIPPDSVPGEDFYFRIGTFVVPTGCIDSLNFEDFTYASDTTSNVFDYHIKRDYYNTLNRGFDLVDVDIDIDSEKIDALSVGADSIPDVQIKDLYFSVGTDESNLLTGSNVTIRINNDIATFSAPQTNNFIGIGCVIYYRGSACYIYKKINDSKWLVKTNLGESVSDLGTTDVISIKYAYNSLYNLFNGISPINDITGFNLRTVRYRLNVTVYKGEVRSQLGFFIRNFDTDIDCYIKIFTPRNLTDECNIPQIHCADPENANFINEGSINIFVDNTVIDGIIMTVDDNSSCATLNNCHNVKIQNNIIFNAGNGIVSKNDGHIDSAIKSDFSDGIDPVIWGPGIVNNWLIKKYGDNDIIYRKSNISAAYESILPAAVEYSGDFDFEFSVISQSSGYVKMAICDDANIVAEMTFNLTSLIFNTKTVLRNHKYGQEYKFRIIRGGLLYPDGIFLKSSYYEKRISLYYFYNNKWNYVNDDYINISADCNFKIKSSAMHGIGYIKIWGIADTNTYLNVGSNENNSFINNVIYGMGQYGIICSGKDYVYNNTVDECDVIGFYNKPTDDLINNISTRCSFFNNENIQYCLSSDSSAGYRNKCMSFVPFEYVDYQSEYPLRNYRPKNDSISMRGTGFSLIEKFSIDATNWIRDRVWDIGALEYIPCLVNIGISSYNTDLKTKKSSSIVTYQVKTFEHYSLIIFSEDQVNNKLAVGCEVVDNNNPFPLSCILTRKLSLRHWIVCDMYGYSLTDRNHGVVSKIYIPNISLSNDIILRFSDLIVGKVRFGIVYFDDNILNSDLSLTNVNADVDHFVQIFAPKNEQTECNKSQKHNGMLGIGAAINSIILTGCECSEISGMQIMNGVTILNSGGVCVWYNIIKNIGLRIDFTKENYIINNLIYECSGYGINTGNMNDYSNNIYDERDWSSVFILNNTISRCRQALRFYKSDYKYTTTAYVRNNLFQYSELRNVACEYSNRKGNFYFRNNIISEDRQIKFLNRWEGNYYLDEYEDFYAVDNAADISRLFVDDIFGSLRELLKWDIGAFESLDITGFGDLNVGEIFFNVNAFNGTIPGTMILYLRKIGDDGNPEANFLTDVNPLVQFNTNEYYSGNPRYSLNEFLKHESQNGNLKLVDNLIIYAQGGETFAGTFTLYDRESRTVTIATFPREIKRGPSTLAYQGPLIDNDSNQSIVEFKNLKIFSTYDVSQDYLINDVHKLRFVNCIVQINNDAIIEEGVIETINSLLIYRNTSNVDTMQLSLKSDDPNTCINTKIISYYNDTLKFQTSPNNNDIIKNNLTYNFSDYPFVFVQTAIDSLESIDPEFKYVTLTERLFDVLYLMERSFLCKKSSPIYDAGDNSYVTEQFDIIGNPRIYISGIVDIGPYELLVNNMIIKSDDIEAIFQDKFSVFDQNFKTRTKVYRDLEIIHRYEFCRESKVVIRLKEFRKDYSYLSDKPNKIIYQVTAYFDSGTRSIILFKTDKYIGGLLNSIFNDGRYEFYFDDIQNLLIIYINNTYDKGKSNIINNVKFGGSAVMMC